MNEFDENIDTSPNDSSRPSAELTEEARAQITEFFEAHEPLFRGIAGTLGFSFSMGKPGETWCIYPETGEAYFDPMYFIDKGYTSAHALDASLHELVSHLIERGKLRATEEGQKIYDKQRSKGKTTPWVEILANIIEDLKGNRTIMDFAPVLVESFRSLYSEHLFPGQDLITTVFKGRRKDTGEEVEVTQKRPKHIQLIYGIIREGMLPDESVIVDDDVREELDKLRAIPVQTKGGVRYIDTIAACTKPGLDPVKTIQIMERYIYPAVERLYKEDLEEAERQQANGDGQEEIEIEGEGESGGSPFEPHYRKYREEIHPEPMNEEEEEEAEEAAAEWIKSNSEAEKANRAYERAHGVSMRDVAEYRNVYRKVEPLFEPIREIIRRIVTQRKSIINGFVRNRKQGVMIDPGLMSQAYIESKRGVDDPPVFMDIKGILVDEKAPGGMNIRVVADKSSSMMGERAKMQREAIIALMEPISELCEAINKIKGNGQLGHDLNINFEARSFGNGQTTLEKRLSPNLNEQERVAIFKSLLQVSGGTNDYDVLEEIAADIRQKMAQSAKYAEGIKVGSQREIVILLTDGDSNHASRAHNDAEWLRQAGVRVIAIGMTREGRGVLTTYGPKLDDAQVCENINDLPKLLLTLLKDILGDLSVTGDRDDILLPEVY